MFVDQRRQAVARHLRATASGASSPRPWGDLNLKQAALDVEGGNAQVVVIDAQRPPRARHPAHHGKWSAFAYPPVAQWRPDDVLRPGRGRLLHRPRPGPDHGRGDRPSDRERLRRDPRRCTLRAGGHGCELPSPRPPGAEEPLRAVKVRVVVLDDANNAQVWAQFTDGSTTPDRLYSSARDTVDPSGLTWTTFQPVPYPLSGRGRTRRRLRPHPPHDGSSWIPTFPTSARSSTHQIGATLDADQPDEGEVDSWRTTTNVRVGGSDHVPEVSPHWAARWACWGCASPSWSADDDRRDLNRRLPAAHRHLSRRLRRPDARPGDGHARLADRAADEGSRPTATVALVGGGIANIIAAYELSRVGIRCTVYEASDRTRRSPAQLSQRPNPTTWSEEGAVRFPRGGLMWHYVAQWVSARGLRPRRPRSRSVRSPAPGTVPTMLTYQGETYDWSPTLDNLPPIVREARPCSPTSSPASTTACEDPDTVYFADAVRALKTAPDDRPPPSSSERFWKSMLKQYDGRSFADVLQTEVFANGSKLPDLMAAFGTLGRRDGRVRPPLRRGVPRGAQGLAVGHLRGVHAAGAAHLSGPLRPGRGRRLGLRHGSGRAALAGSPGVLPRSRPSTRCSGSTRR